MKVVSSRFDGLMDLAEIVLDVIGHEIAVQNPAGPKTLALGDLSRSIDMYAQPHAQDALRSLVKKRYPDISEETLDNIHLGVKTAASITKLAYCTAMMVAGNPVPMMKMGMRQAFDMIRENEGIRTRLFGIMRDDGIDPDDRPPGGGKMRIPEPRRDTSVVSGRAFVQQAAVGGRRAMLRHTPS